MQPERRLACFCTSLAALAAVTGSARAQRQITQTLGDQPFARYGQSLAAVGDVDGDGVRDLVIGEPGRDYSSTTWDSGAAVLRSSRTGAMRSRNLALQANGWFGSAVAGLGDVDGDGVPDWAAGGWNMGTNRSGYVRVMSGADGHQLWDLGGEIGSELGTAIAGLGDLNGDGRPDLAVAAPHNSNLVSYGTVRCRVGRSGQFLQEFAGLSNASTGKSIAAIADVSGDGQPDLVIGEPECATNGANAGRVFLVNPRPGASPRILWESYLSFGANWHGGYVVAGIGDINGDQVPDVLAAATNGIVAMLSGSDGTRINYLWDEDISFGASLAGIGDFDGDGRADFAIGEPNVNNGSGRVIVYSGVNAAVLVVMDGPAGSHFGAALAGVGDVDGDGRADLAIGAPDFVSGGQVLGRVSIHGFTITSIMDTFGTGCAGSAGVPFVYMGGNARVGASFDTRCGNLPRNGAGLWLTGWSRTSASGTPLPFDLGVYGFTGCRLLVSPDETLLFLTGAPNYVARTWNVPNLPSLAGATIYTQAAMFDSTRPGGMSFSDGGRIRIGNG